MPAFENIVITDIIETVTVCAAAGRHLKMDSRFCFGLSFCESGKITYIHNGRKFISDRDTAVFLPMGATYELYNNAGGRFPLINFLCTEPFTDEFITVPLKHADNYLKDFASMHDFDLPQRNPYRNMSILYDILDKLSRESSDQDPMLFPASEFILKNLSNPDLDNTLISEYAGISECYLRRLFRKNYNTTPKQYILDMRVKKAGRLLCETTCSVTDISYECGFSSVYHFCRAFRKVTGITPSEYRKSYRENGI